MSTRSRETVDVFELMKRRASVGRDLEKSGLSLYATPYLNTIDPSEEPEYPGNRDLDEWLTNLCRFNAAAMVTRANRRNPGLGGHISTYASTATLFETALHHVLRASDLVYLQGHASPGIYARAYLEGRLSDDDLDAFRREVTGDFGLSSYPHPHLMPDFWQFPTVSMGLGPILSIYQARFLRYLRDRELLQPDEADRRVWCFLGDGECDEPEARAALSLASRASLANLVFVVNCNLQRLDGPVRGNQKIIQELEGLFAGCGWRVIKVLWGSAWDPLLQSELGPALARRLNQLVDGEVQRLAAEPVPRLRDELFTDELRPLIENHSDADLRALTWGGHDPVKVYAAYAAALAEEERPTVILAQTIKGFGFLDEGQAWNATHKMTALGDDVFRKWRRDLGIPNMRDPTQYFRPDQRSRQSEYLVERRMQLGGFLPAGARSAAKLRAPALVERVRKGGRKESTTLAFNRILEAALDAPTLRDHLVPIIADEGRTFGWEGLFSKYGLYSPVSQRYEPVDADSLQYYREEKQGRIIEEGITEAGAMSTFIAAGTAHSTLGTVQIPIYLFYSMFGFQRVGDLIWAAADARARGFLLGCTAGRTTLSGEGLQHQDGHSQLLASTVPNVRAYDPAFAYEVHTIFEDGLRRIAEGQEDVLYYLTLYNERASMPEMPPESRSGILEGIYCLRGNPSRPAQVQLLGSGSILHEILRAADLLRTEFDIKADVYSITSYQLLREDALRAEQRSRLEPRDPAPMSVLSRALGASQGPFVIASDWISLIPEQIARFLPGPVTILGTDGFGRSDTRAGLRRFFAVDAASIAHAALSALVRHSAVPASLLRRVPAHPHPIADNVEKANK